jgi:uncharacterized membrane protein YgdD (TMEM256/DUF423 family)
MKWCVASGAVFCFLGVLAGALGSHALADLLEQGNNRRLFELATAYMFYHGLALLAVGLAKGRYPHIPFEYVAWLFVAGSTLFQGNLYLLSLAGSSPLRMLTPLGGLCLMAGWVLLAVCALRVP